MDQIFMRLAKRDGLRRRGGARQVAPNTVTGAARGRTADGKPLAGRIAGVSKARQLIDAAKAKREAEVATKQEIPRRERRKKRGI